MVSIHRGTHKDGPSTGIAVTAVIGTCREIIYDGISGGMIYIPAGSAVISLTPYVTYELGGTYYPLYSVGNVPIAMTVAHTRAYPIPEEAFGAVGLKFVANDTGVIHVSLKG